MANILVCDICKNRIDDGETHGFIAALYEESWRENMHKDLCEDCLYEILEFTEKLEKDHEPQIAYGIYEEAQNENNP